MERKAIAYYRVSTAKQGQSGLGLEAQQESVRSFLKRDPDFEFTDIESGKSSTRQGFLDARNKCKEVGGILVIAKLDRLSRNVHFISGLMEAKINFVCCDNPSATPLTIHIFAAVAEQEARAISQRVKDALGVLKNKGVKLGSPKGKSGFETKGNEARELALISLNKKKMGNENSLRAKGAIKMMLDYGEGVGKMVAKLRENGYLTPSGSKHWTAMQVYRIIDNYGLREKNGN